MSGIAAIVRFDGAPVERWLIEAMARSMAHRGPDGIGLWSSGPAVLGHCMFRTTPESLEETQPRATEDASVVLSMDGRLDNGEELRAELEARGGRLRDRSDVELALRAYEAWGRDCVERLEGDFALIVWDAGRREVFCARDRMGHKPFHYHWDGRCLAVASELHAILALPWVDEELNDGVIAERLADAFSTLDETLWKGILRLGPAHRMTVDALGPRLERYWKPDLRAELRYRREEECVEHYQALLAESVRRHCRSLGPLSFEVSGGLDSSAVLGTAHRLARRGAVAGQGIEAYTLAFEDGAAGADLGHARALAAHLGCPLHEVPPTSEPLEWHRDWASRYRDLPPAPHGTMHLGILEAARARGGRVVLGGVGGDQWLTGDHSYLADNLVSRRWAGLAAALTRDARAYGWRGVSRLALRHGVIPSLPWPVRRNVRWLRDRLRPDARRRWLAGPLAGALAERSDGSLDEIERQRPAHRQRLRFLLSARLVAASEAMDLLAASAGVERRSPLDTAALAQFGFAVPQEWLLRDGWDRYIHRRAFAGVLPDAIAWRRDKAEFSVMLERHRDELREALDPLVATSLDPWVTREGLRRLSAGPEAGAPASMLRLWSLFGCDAVRRAGDRRAKFRRREAVDG